MKEVEKIFSNQPEKEYAVPDCRLYQCLYLIKNAVSDLKDEDFALGALEYRTNKLHQAIQELKTHRESKPNSPIPVWLVTFPIISWILAWLVWRLVWKTKSQPSRG